MPVVPCPGGRYPVSAVLDRTRYIAVLATAAGVILIGGAWLRPRTNGAARADPSDAELAALARTAERRAIDDQATFFADAASRASASMAYVPATGASAIRWHTGLVVTAQRDGTRLPTTLRLETPGGSHEAS